MPINGETPKGIIVFKIAEQELCFDIDFLSEILKPGEVDLRPANRLNSLRIDFDGCDYLPVDLTPAFGSERRAVGRCRRILLVEFKGRRVALDVEAVTQVISCVPGERGHLTFVPTDDTPNCLGYYDTGGGKIWRIDFDSITRDSPAPGDSHGHP